MHTGAAPLYSYWNDGHCLKGSGKRRHLHREGMIKKYEDRKGDLIIHVALRLYREKC